VTFARLPPVIFALAGPTGDRLSFCSICEALAEWFRRRGCGPRTPEARAVAPGQGGGDAGLAVVCEGAVLRRAGVGLG